MRKPQSKATLFLILPALCIAQPSLRAAGFVETGLVSDIPGEAAITDPNLVNPWGIAESATSPFWIADNGTGLSTVYKGGTPQSLVVTIPPPAGGTPPAAPTGVIFNSIKTAFKLGNSQPANFIFDTEDGTVSAWNSGSGTTAALEVDNSASGAVYKGLALGTSVSGPDLYAANFNSGKIDVFNSHFAPTTLAGSFTDPNLPAGYAPFDVQNIGNKLYVTYALQDAAKHDDVAGAGHGFVDVFDLNGNLLQRLISGGPLNSPWGLALAPSSFGQYAGDLLVGNFGDGHINAFNPGTGAFLGTMDGVNGNPLEIPGLWGLIVGNGGNGGSASDLYFTAGIPGPGGAVEDHGLFGQIGYQAPEGGTNTACALGAALVGLLGLRRWPVTLATRKG